MLEVHEYSKSVVLTVYFVVFNHFLFQLPMKDIISRAVCFENESLTYYYYLSFF